LILHLHGVELSELVGMPFLNLLCDLLYKALKLETPCIPESGRIEDYSYIWRPNLAQEERGDSIKDLLASAVLSAADRLCAQSPELFEHIAQILRAKRFKLFERIEIELVARHAELGPDAVKGRLLDKDLFNDIGVRTEYYALAEKRYSALDEPDQARILRWIEQGPDTTALRERSGLSAEQIEQQVEYWRLERLAPIREYLPTQWRRRYGSLEQKFGAPRHAAQAVVTRGPYAVPLKAFQPERDLAVMSVGDVFEYVKSWRPANPTAFPLSPGESEHGLAAVLSDIVQKRAGEFSEHASEFEVLDPTYVRAAVQGFEGACREKTSFSWSRVLDLCAWIVSQPVDIPGRSGDVWSRDPDWRWARQAVIGLIDEGFKQKAIPFELRDEIRTILESLAAGDSQGDLPFDDEESQKHDIWTASINRAKPRAIRSVLKYVEWCRDNSGSKEFSLALAPNAGSLLHRHLDADFDPSLDVRLIYGEFLPFLIHVDAAWITQHVESIFPGRPPLRPLRDVAWAAYLGANPAYDAVFQSLRSMYLSAIGEIGTPRFTGSGHLLDDPDGNLANHLMQLYWRGEITLDPGEPLDQFYSRASDKLAAQMVGYVGRSMSEMKEPIPAEVLARLGRLWTLRLQQVTGTQHANEMAAFGWWFNSGSFEDKWALDRLQQTLQRSGGSMEPKLGTLKRLARLADKYPSEVISCTEMIVNAEPVYVILWVDDLRSILGTIVRVGDAGAVRRAHTLIHSLGSRGYHEYRDLLQ
jgi:hypothetical protein